ncbi:DUF3299 domain-containing protein [Bythopirellula polymerisocia]|uniref:DUF3299 domain-containing protein n=1 Tax=Bythopirellula polymerisocia TaxID=2528003 RepID=A0A5C6CUH9_9BACT|nr:DUF3299 domain-containing protein [Bythopirellula polymerisocia]TWU28230.1 hypothetical protein Pla144_15170 [Bythopirellula polymerisocia]
MNVLRHSVWILAFLLLSGSIGCERTPVAAVTGAKPSTNTAEVRETTFDDLKFEMEKTDDFARSMITPKIEDVFDRKIRIRGYMYPTLKRKGLKGFVLVRDNLECCFGPGAALYDCIRVEMDTDETAEFSIRPIAVEGVLRFEEFADMDGTTRAIYLLQEGSVD